MRTRTTALLTALSLVAAAPASAFEMGSLAPLLDTGKDGAWDQRDEDGFFVMDNDTREGAVRYFYVNPKDGEAGRRKVSVEIDLRDETLNSRAGILYAFKTNPKSYYVFTLDADKSLSLIQIGGGRMSRKLKSQMSNVTDGVNTLELVEEDKKIHLFVNGERVSSLGNDSMGQGAIGIVAIDRGEYAFRNFSLGLADQ